MFHFIFLLATICCSRVSLEDSERFLGVVGSHVYPPFSLRPGKQMLVSRQKLVGKTQNNGVILEIVRASPLIPSFEEQLKALAGDIPFLTHPKFLGQVNRVFSSPWVRTATFMEWKTRSGIIMKQGYALPDTVRLRVADDSGRKIDIAFQTFTNQYGDPIFQVEFFKAKETVFEMSMMTLKDVLEHATGRAMPRWLVSKISTKLAHDPDPHPFRIEVPRNPVEFAQVDRNSFHFLNHHQQQVEEKFDGRTQILVDYISTCGKLTSVVIKTAGGQKVTVRKTGSADAETDFMNFRFEKKRGEAVRLSQDWVSQVLYRLSGVVVPRVQAARVARKLAEHPRLMVLKLAVETGIDLKIEQILAAKRTY